MSSTPTILKVVIDTNTWVSAALKAPSIPDQAVQLATQTALVLSSQQTYAELEAVLLREKFDRYRSIAARLAFLEAVKSNTQPLEVTSQITACRHPKDDKFLELAIDGHADLILTGDNDLLTLDPFRGIEIITPTDFLTRFGS